MSLQSATVSHWWDDLGIPAATPAARGHISADVCIVGAGYTGLWTSYYLKKLDPSLSVVLLDAHFAGYGASGRNGGWLTNSITGGREQYVQHFGRDLTSQFQSAMTQTVYEVIHQVQHNAIEADIALGGELNVAMNPAQHERLLRAVEQEQRWNVDIQYVEDSGLSEHVDIAGALSGMWQPHCARIHPAKLASGLRDAVIKQGVQLCENSHVAEIAPGTAIGDNFTVMSPRIVRATEGFTADFSQFHRDWLPMNSTLLVTKPLSEAFWKNVGWEQADVVGDMAHVYMYAQRTADGRIALGGRGVPYRYGSNTNATGSTSARTRATLAHTLLRMFPGVHEGDIERTWSGVLGVPRDWAATVGFDQRTGIGWAGGYVGTGVTATNLAARTLRDLMFEPDSALCQLPWVNHTVRKWEPEPLRWLATRSLYAGFRVADRLEQRAQSSRTSFIAHLANALTGRH